MLQEKVGRIIPVIRVDIYMSICLSFRGEKERERKKGGETSWFFFSCRCLEIILPITLLQVAQTNGTVMTYSHEDRNYFIKSVGRYS